MVVEVSFRDEPAAVVDAPAAEEKGPPALPPTVGRSLMNLEIFMVVFVVVVVVVLNFEVSVSFVLEVGLVGGGWAAVRIRMVSPDEVV